MKKIIGLALLGAFLAIQIIRPDLTNPAVDPAQDFKQIKNPPAEVHTLLKTACYDCHSNETIYPWYSQVAPVSWFVASHIREGREHLNFSTFGVLPAEDQAEVLEEVPETIQEGEMPLSSYTWIHPEARLSAAQKDVLIRWFLASGGDGGVEPQSSAEPNGAAEHVEVEDD